jgi:hypothetical protein
VEAACWAHARRPFFALADIEASARREAEGKAPAPISPLALEAVRRIDALFEIERAINGRGAEERRAVRQDLSAPLVADLEAWMREERPKLPRGSDVAKAMDYMLKRWAAFSRFLTTGASVFRTMPSAPCAGSPRAQVGCSRVPIAAGDAPPPCTA